MKILQQFLILSIVIVSCTDKPLFPERLTDKPSVPKLYARVNDYAYIFTDDQETTLNKLLKSVEDSIGSQLAILSIDSLGGLSIEEYSMDVVENWKLGRRNYNDGLLITLAIQERKIRIEVGYGLELIITDEIAKKILDHTMVPHFKDGDFYSGITEGLNEIINLIHRNSEMVGKQWESDH